MGAVLAWAIHWRWVGGLVAAVVLSLADLAIRDDLTQKVYGNLFLLLVGGPIVGLMVGLLQRWPATRRPRPSGPPPPRPSAQRLARAVHDGVLQVLALVQRRAPELGPDGVSWAGWPASRRCRSAGPDPPAGRGRPGAPAWSTSPGAAVVARAPRAASRWRASGAAYCCRPSGRRGRGRRGGLPRQRRGPRRAATRRRGCCSRSSPTRSWSSSATRGRASRRAARGGGSRGPARGRSVDPSGGCAELGRHGDADHRRPVGHRVGAQPPAADVLGSPRDDPRRSIPSPTPSPTRSAGSGAGSAGR